MTDTRTYLIKQSKSILPGQLQASKDSSATHPYRDMCNCSVSRKAVVAGCNQCEPHELTCPDFGCTTCEACLSAEYMDKLQQVTTNRNGTISENTRTHGHMRSANNGSVDLGTSSQRPQGLSRPSFKSRGRSLRNAYQGARGSGSLRTPPLPVVSLNTFNEKSFRMKRETVAERQLQSPQVPHLGMSRSTTPEHQDVRFAQVSALFENNMIGGDSPEDHANTVSAGNEPLVALRTPTNISIVLLNGLRTSDKSIRTLRVRNDEVISLKTPPNSPHPVAYCMQPICETDPECTTPTRLSLHTTRKHQTSVRDESSPSYNKKTSAPQNSSCSMQATEGLIDDVTEFNTESGHRTRVCLS